MPEWINIDTDENNLRINKYFIDNPQMILGKWNLYQHHLGKNQHVFH